MATQALYNKWRGQTFADVLGQEHITRTLQNQIKAGRIGHAYLFTGLRGTGKTSTARIMAKAVNCIGQTDDPPCNRCVICRSITEGRSLDLIEIDSASNRGIDEIRDLRDKVAFAPSECRYKVYVIDEVHMLTNEAFNALLKTLEEPPSHVIFILCTTEPHRLPDTVLSRCQRFDFRRASLPMLLSNLRHICEAENIRIAPDALEYIARRATGSFRDSVSLLDQLAAYSADEITLEQVQNILGTVPAEMVASLVSSLMRGDVPAGLRVLNEAIDSGAEPHQFLTEILDHLRALMLLTVGSHDELHAISEEGLAELRQIAASETFSLGRVVQSIKLFNDAGRGLRTAARPQLPLELAFVEAAAQLGPGATPAVLTVSAPAQSIQRAPDARPEPAPSSGQRPTQTATEHRVPSVTTSEETPPPKPTAGEPVVLAKEAPAQAVTERPASTYATLPSESAAPTSESSPAVPAGPSSESPRLTLQWVQGKWQQLLLRMRSIDPKVRAMLNSTKPVEVKGDTVLLACEAPFHRDMLSEDKRREVVDRVLSEVMGTSCHIKCIVDVAAASAANPASGESSGASRPAEDLFTRVDNNREDVRQRLRSHPVVKELEKRGGQVVKVSLVEEEQEGNRGK